MKIDILESYFHFLFSCFFMLDEFEIEFEF